jgi:putative transposase
MGVYMNKEARGLPFEVNQELFDALSPLMEPCDRKTYSLRLREVAERLGKSKRTIQRLMKRWQEVGISAFAEKERSDKGLPRVSPEWKEFIVETYKKGNSQGRKMSPIQVFGKVRTRAAELGVEEHPSHMTVYRLLNPIIEEKKLRKSIRSPGWQGSKLVLPTRDGKQLNIEYSNQVWQCDHTPADILLVDKDGRSLGRPYLTTVADTYSRCLMGFQLGFYSPSSHAVALALRHAILPKAYGEEYGLNCEWGTYGLPQYLYTDGGKDFRSNHLQQIGAQLGFTSYLRRFPANGGVIERPFGTFNTQFFSTLPGYTGSNVQERPEDAEKNACLTIDELNKLFTRYIVDNYNQSLDARMGDQTRFQRWEAGLTAIPLVPSERELDLCLMKTSDRRVQRGGTIQFENIIYKGEHLAGYEGTQVSLRYDPADITSIWVYRREKGQEVFLTRAHAIGLETTSLTFADAKFARKQLREAQKSIDNHSIMAEVERRDQDVAKTVKERRQKAQKEHQLQSLNPSHKTDDVEDPNETDDCIADMLASLQPVKALDLNEDY